MSFNYLNLCKPNEHREEYQKANNKNFLFEIEDKKYIYVGDKVVTFETNDKMVNYSSDLGFNDINYPFAYGDENIYFMLHQKYISIQEYKISTEKKRVSLLRLKR